jgi:hypothetical protein
MKKRIWLALIASGMAVPGPRSSDFERLFREQRPNLTTAAAAKAAAAQATVGQAATNISEAATTGGTFITFDIPGAGTSSSEGTYAFAINGAGATTGYYIDANGVPHGFLRASGGTITTFDAPDDVNGTYPSGINSAGVITGYSYDANFVAHGFLRASDGTVTTFDAPDDVNGTYPSGINSAGVITGYYWDANFATYGFLRNSDGSITTFEASDAGTDLFAGTYPGGINPQGTISGCYLDANYAGHNFLRGSDGTFTAFDVSNGTLSTCGSTFSQAASMGFTINAARTVTGNYFQPIQGNPFGGNFRGFVRSSDGVITTFDAATYSPCCIWTFGIAINPAGTIAGYFNDGHNLNRGFLRTSDGSVTILDAPGARHGTVANDINPAGEITGSYVDASAVSHGFLWKRN